MILAFDHGAVRELRLNRPPANALTPELIVALTRAVNSAPNDGVRALVLSGAPGRFCAGLDVPLLLTFDRPAMAFLWRELYALMRALACSPIPIAAALTGHAPAGGTVLPLFCDWRAIAEGDFKMGLNEVQVGIPLPPVILAALRRLVGARQAEHLAVGGLIISAAQAASIGLVDAMVPADQVVDHAVRWCSTLLAVPPTAMASTRRQARADLTGLFDQSLEREIDEVVTSWWTAEAQTVLRSVADRLTKKKST
jgi:Delta3-Delta2-enoyl-CoA isomerase